VKGNEYGTGPAMFCGKLAAIWDIDLQHWQAAIGEGWFELTGSDRRNKEVNVIGADGVSENNESSEGDTPAAEKTTATPRARVTKDSVKAMSKSNKTVVQKHGRQDTGTTGALKRTCRARRQVLRDCEEEEEDEEDEEEYLFGHDNGEDDEEEDDEEGDDKDKNNEEDES
jgi:hypothetical protein